jgi:hypothetical protein
VCPLQQKQHRALLLLLLLLQRGCECGLDPPAASPCFLLLLLQVALQELHQQEQLHGVTLVASLQCPHQLLLLLKAYFQDLTCESKP